MKLILTISFYILLLVNDVSSYKKKRVIVEHKISPKFDNPNFVRDRIKDEIKVIIKQLTPKEVNINDTELGNYTEIRKPVNKEAIREEFHSPYMDYCDPYHCNDYHRAACGLNRDKMHFKWFQSVCHMILNNKCATYRGTLKYDIIDNKFCTLHVMHLRSKCPTACDDDDVPVCAINSSSGQVVLFRNKCSMVLYNCRSEIPGAFNCIVSSTDLDECEHS